MRKITIALVAVLLLTTGYVVAQVTTANLPTTTGAKVTLTVPAGTTSVTMARPSEPIPLTDLGLKIEGEHDGRVYGTLVVKVDGRWVEVQLASKSVRVQQ